METQMEDTSHLHLTEEQNRILHDLLTRSPGVRYRVLQDLVMETDLVVMITLSKTDDKTFNEKINIKTRGEAGLEPPTLDWGLAERRLAAIKQAYSDPSFTHGVLFALENRYQNGDRSEQLFRVIREIAETLSAPRLPAEEPQGGENP